MSSSGSNYDIITSKLSYFNNTAFILTIQQMIIALTTGHSPIFQDEPDVLQQTA